MKIHILCDSPKTMSGFANVGTHLAQGLFNLGHEVTMSGFQTAYDSEWYNDIEVMPTNVQYIDDLTQYTLNITKSAADLALCIFNSDDANQNLFAKTVRPTFFYTPVEGRNISDMMAGDLYQVSQNGKIIAQCNWGHDEMLKAGVESTVIYHGYDPDVFYKTKDIVPDKIKVLRYVNGKWAEELFSDNTFNGKFIFGFVGANHGIRKRIERLLTAYALFLKDNKQRQDRTLLVLRTMPISVTSPANLIRICAQLEISKNVVFLYGDNNRLSNRAMNVIYNIFDVNVSASSSEGFGLSTLESMAIGIPQIGPACSSFIELILDEKDRNKSRGLIAEKGEWVMINDGSYRFQVNEKCLSQKMEEMYNNKDLRDKFSKNASKFSEKYTWEKVIKQWDDLINSFSISNSIPK